MQPRWLLGVSLAAALLVACSSDDAQTPAGGAGGVGGTGGESGTAGAVSGAAGTGAHAGSSGNNGTAGTTAGTSGGAGSSGASGAGNAGTSGTAGNGGSSGSSGTSGVAGNAGTSGVSGTAGASAGTAGIAGSAGTNSTGGMAGTAGSGNLPLSCAEAVQTALSCSTGSISGATSLGLGSTNFDGYTSTIGMYPGKERVYVFQNPIDTYLSVSVDNTGSAAGDWDLFLLDGEGAASCSDALPVLGSDTSSNPSSKVNGVFVPANTPVVLAYDLYGNATPGAETTFDLTVNCSTLPLNCAEAVQTPLGCSSGTVTGNTASGAGTTNFDQYLDNSSHLYPGKERVYVFESPVGTFLSVNVDNTGSSTGDWDLFLLDGDGADSCSDALPVLAKDTGTADPSTVKNIWVPANTPVVVSYDAYGAVNQSLTSTFDLTVACNSLPMSCAEAVQTHLSCSTGTISGDTALGAGSSNFDSYANGIAIYPAKERVYVFENDEDTYLSVSANKTGSSVGEWDLFLLDGSGGAPCSDTLPIMKSDVAQGVNPSVVNSVFVPAHTPVVVVYDGWGLGNASATTTFDLTVSCADQ